MDVLIGLLAVVVGPAPPLNQTVADSESFLKASLRLLSSLAFRWLFIGSVSLGFAAAPCYVFAVPFLIRTRGFSSSEAGLAFGLLQCQSGPLIAIGCQARNTLAGSWSFSRSLPHVDVRVGSFNVWTGYCICRQPIDRSHRNHRPGGDIAGLLPDLQG